MVGLNKCLDTYALIEIAKGNIKFKQYTKLNFVTTDLNLAEFYNVTLREEGLENANLWFKKLEPYSVPVDKLILIEAVIFRRKNIKKNISFFDAVGYIFSIKNGYAFVTGDKEFENLQNVEFIKK